VISTDVVDARERRQAVEWRHDASIPPAKPSPALRVRTGGRMSHQDPTDAAGKPAQGQLTRETQDTKRGAGATSEPNGAATSEPNPATMTAAAADTPADLDPVTYEAGWDSTAGQTALLGGFVYVWWLFIGGSLQILFGGMYFGTQQQTQIHALSSSWFNLSYTLLGAFMVTLAFGFLRLERWAMWGAWLGSAASGALAVIEIVRWAEGTPITLEVAFFSAMDLLFVLYNFYFLSQAETRKLLRFKIFRGSPFAPGMALCGIALGTASLAVTLVITHIDKRLNTPDLLLVYLLGTVLVIVMAFMAVKMRRWVWWGDLAWAAILAGLSIYWIAHQVADEIVPKGGKVDTQGLILSGVNLVFVAIVVYLLFLPAVREAIFGVDRKQPLFSPRTLIGGLSLAVLAAVIYLLSGDLGTLTIAYTVFGLVMGTIVGLLPGADPANRISAYFAGLLLAFASYVVRGGILPYTKGSAALVVLVMLVIVTGITAVVRSRAWFALMLLGVGTMYGLVEPLFQAAPIGYLASAGLALVGIFLGFVLGFSVSTVLELELVPYKPNPALASQTTTGSSAPSSEPARDNTRAKADAR
jgi:hypothetical protein